MVLVARMKSGVGRTAAMKLYCFEPGFRFAHPGYRQRWR
jgi:hypothetical protein